MGKLDEAVDLYSAGKYAQAITQILAFAPDAGSENENTDAAYYAGLSYMRLKRYEDALNYLEQVVTSGASIERIRQCRLLLAVAYTLTGRERLADFELKKLLDTGYQSASMYSALAYIAWTQGKHNDAIAYYDLALKQNDSNVTALNGLGYVLAETGKDLTRALSLCKRAVQLAPASSACLDSLGWAYFKLGLLADAKACIKKAREKGGGHEEIESHFTAVLQEERASRENTKLADAAERGR